MCTNSAWHKTPQKVPIRRNLVSYEFSLFGIHLNNEIERKKLTKKNTKGDRIGRMCGHYKYEA